MIPSVGECFPAIHADMKHHHRTTRLAREHYRTRLGHVARTARPVNRERAVDSFLQPARHHREPSQSAARRTSLRCTKSQPLDHLARPLPIESRGVHHHRSVIAMPPNNRNNDAMPERPNAPLPRSVHALGMLPPEHFVSQCRSPHLSSSEPFSLPPAIAKRTAFFGVRRLVYPGPRKAGAFTAECHATGAAVAGIVACLTLATIFLAALCLPPSVRTDQPTYDTVGTIEGEDVSVQGPLNIEVVQGRTRTILRSGSDVRVKSGQARIDLVEGGQIAVCGPAHLSVLKSVNLLTVALDTGTIHARIERQPTLTIYTAQIQAKPIAIGDAPQDALVGFDQTGAMCIRADSGAVRVEQQLTAQTIIVPQNGEVLITNGQLEGLRSGVTHCSCELQLAKTLTTTPPQSEVSRLPTSEEMQGASRLASKAPEPSLAPSKPAPSKPAAKEGPVYQ